MKNNNKTISKGNSKNCKNSSCKPIGNDHTQKEGVAFYEGNRCFLFAPDIPVQGQLTGFSRRGVARQLTDGTFEFVPKPRAKSQSITIRKLNHGRVSYSPRTGCIYLNLVIPGDSLTNIPDTIVDEADKAAYSVRVYESCK